MDRAELVATLEFAEQGLARNDLIPQLKSFCFDKDVVWAFNDTIGVSIPYDTGIACTVDGRTLLDLLRCSTTNDVTFKLKGNDLIVTCGKAVMKLPTGSADSFFELCTPPDVPKNASTIHCDEQFLIGLTACLTTASRDQSKPALMGVTINGSSLVSCDGDAITRYAINDIDEIGNTLLPLPFCEALLKAPRSRQSLLAVTKGWAVAKCGNIEIYGRLLENPDPPDFDALIKDTLKDAPHYVKTNDALSEALNRAAVMADPTSAKTAANVLAKTLILTTDTAMGTVIDTVPFDHPDVTVHVMASLMQRALGVCDEVSILTNCTVFRKGDTVLQVVGNMGE